MQREIEELQRWYESQCDGDWEHEFGVKVGTLDNPGWMVDIDLEGTSLEDMEPERDWISCDVRENTFRGRGGPLKLGRILRVFLDWAHAAGDD